MMGARIPDCNLAKSVVASNPDGEKQSGQGELTWSRMCGVLVESDVALLN